MSSLKGLVQCMLAGHSHIIITLGFFIYKLLAPAKHGVRNQLVQKSSQKELPSKAK